MPKTSKKSKCDHKNAGVLIYGTGNRILLVSRAKKPYGWSPPATHVDGDGENFRAAAKRAVAEKTGLDAKKFVLLLKRTCDNQCIRKGGGWHNLRVFKALEWSGKLMRSKTETRGAGWISQAQIMALARMTEDYMKGKISQKAWRKNPGLEVLWHKIFRNLGII